MAVDLRVTLQDALAADYVLEDELPRGGMSRVFLAVEKSLKRKVVLKVLDPELAATLSAERFKREITLAARLQHPHIVPLLHSGAVNGLLFYSMPFVEGESLRELMARERPMSVDRISQILLEVSGALDFAHAQGVVHRDIKPENVMLFHGQAVVLDFGIAKAVSDASAPISTNSAPRLTLQGTSLGTPTYIAPEQAAGDPSLDHRADIYSLGCVAYEMLCGHPPFRGKSPQAVMIAHAKEVPEPITKRRPDAPPALAKLVMACLAKEPQQRPQRAEQIVKALRPHHDDGGGLKQTVDRLPWWLPWVLAAVSTAAAIGLALSRRV